MRYVIVVGLVASILCGRERAAAQERGLVAFKANIVKVHNKSLDLVPFDRVGEFARGESIQFDVTDDARFEEVDFKLSDGKLTTTRKAIAVGDLVPSQSINIIAVFAGNRPTVLVGVVAGGKSSEAEALKLITKLGGSVRDFGRKEIGKLLLVNLSNTAVTDDALDLIASLDDMDMLDLSNTKITDNGVAHLAGHRKLRTVILSETKVTDDVFDHLDKLPGLETVSIDRTAITRDAIVRFAKNGRLTNFCQISAGPKGEYRIYEQLRDERGGPTPYVYLMKRNTYYGRFYAKESLRRKATTYYHRDGPVGAVLRRFEWFPQDAQEHASDARLPASVTALSTPPVGGIPISALASLWSEPAIGVVELNAGTIAAYGRPFQTIDFFNDLPELVPFNVKVAGKEPPLGFVEDARARGSKVRIIGGQFKKIVRQDAPRGFYSAIFVDITVQQPEFPKVSTKNDVHFDLLTQEAIRDLIDTTTPDGLVCYHTSHRTHEFSKPLAAAAAKLGLSSKRVKDRFYGRDGKVTVDDAHFGSEWLVVGRTKEHLERFRTEKSRTRDLIWDVPPTDEWPAWRDGVEPKMPKRE